MFDHAGLFFRRTGRLRGGGTRVQLLVVAAALALAASAVVILLQPESSSQSGGSSGHIPRTPAERAMVRAEDLLSAGQVAPAVAHLESFLATNPSSVPPRAMLARVYLVTEKPDLARQHLDRALAEDANHPAALWVRGLLALADGQDPEPYFARAARQDRAGPVIHAEYGLYLMDTGRADQAEPHLARAVESELDQPAVYEALAQVAFDQGRFDRTVELSSRAVQLDSTSVRGWAMLGEAARQMGDMDRAAEALDRAVACTEPGQKADVLMQVARLQQSRQQWDQAVATCREVMKLSPSYRPMAALRAAICLYFAGSYDDAADAIAVARRAGPDDPQVKHWAEKIADAQQKQSSQAPSSQPASWFDVAPPQPTSAPTP